MAQWRKAHEATIVRELADLVAIPDVASDRPNIEKNARHLLGLLRKRGVEARLLEEPGSPPALYGELRTPGAQLTVLFYAHYDGQPVDPSQWIGGAPFKPVLRSAASEAGGQDLPMPAEGQPVPEEARLYGRATSDDKAAIVAMLTALDAMRANKVTPSVNLKFYFEGEEEAGSPHFRAFLEHNRDLLKSDAWVMCDGPVHQSRRMAVVYGVRGSVTFELTLYGANRTLHSGHYGNWAPNPAALMANLIATMRDPDGKVTIAGFYDRVRPLTDADRRALAAVPKIDPELRKSFGLAHTESNDAPNAERILMPALNVRGLLSGHVGAQAANAIPTEAKASFDIRLVPDMTTEQVKEVVERHLTGQGYFLVREAPDAATRAAHARILRIDWGAGYPGIRTPMDLPFARAVTSIVAEAANGPIVQLPNMGGSLPIYLINDVLGAPLVIVPIANHDNNQHAANENLRMRNLWDGIEIFAALFTRLGTVWTGRG
ncbi:MAG TPA: M20/M25/M40 family metallo-hydrolase [Myxococcaceae bacterium]|nr:M20/M25/M40 family metallo-hydrolase [Myxococcaceae bacterium]